MTNSGDAAETVVRVMLTGTELALRLTASARSKAMPQSKTMSSERESVILRWRSIDRCSSGGLPR